MTNLTVAQSYRPSMTRTITKAATYKMLTFLAVLVLTYWRTGDIKTSLTVGGVDLIVKTIIYIAHERFWARIDTGKQSA